MTLAEVNRYIDSRKRVKKIQDREKASFNYILADLIGRSVSRVYSSSNTLPDISTVYPTLFTQQEIDERKQEKLTELYALRFKQFAQSHNNKFNREVEE